jgi:tetratricopeptide (TPR) repeat protein
VKLTAQVAPRRYTPGLEAYEAYLRALHEAQKLIPEGMARAREWFERAIALDSRFALAHGMFGFHFAQLANYALLPAHDAMPLVRREARKALAIEPSLPEGHAMLGLVAALYEYDWSAAERHFAAAMACDPIPSAVRRFHALYYLLPVGRSGEAADECARALEDDPLNLVGRLRLAQCLRAAGRDAEATRELRRVLELDHALHPGSRDPASGRCAPGASARRKGVRPGAMESGGQGTSRGGPDARGNDNASAVTA